MYLQNPLLNREYARKYLQDLIVLRKMRLTLQCLQLAASVNYLLLIYPNITCTDIVTKKLKKHI